MTAPEWAAALLAAGKLTTAQQVRCVELGWLTAEQASPAAQTQLTNLASIRAQAAAALATNKTIASGATTIVNGANTYLAIPAPSTVQAVAQVKALTQAVKMLAEGVNALATQNNGLIRLALQQLDNTD